MVVMNDDLWSKIVDNLYGTDEVLTQRMDDEVHIISDDDVQCVIDTLRVREDRFSDVLTALNNSKEN